MVFNIVDLVKGFKKNNFPHTKKENSKFDTYSEDLKMNRDPVFAEVMIGPEDDIKPFLREIGFSDQSVIIHPEGHNFPIFKGLTNYQSVQLAIRDCLRFSDATRVVVKTELNAYYN